MSTARVHDFSKVDIRLSVLTWAIGLCLASVSSGQAASAIPHLQREGTATQLIVEDRPFLIRGGEINNSSATNPASFERHWTKLQSLNLHTVLVPAYWHLLEPA